ncbi:MAG: hypothetical protein M5U34_42425 [Chloroflexi bacterium]|nr:hypothetical protein [Chloroflexota bacterium]
MISAELAGVANGRCPGRGSSPNGVRMKEFFNPIRCMACVTCSAPA